MHSSILLPLLGIGLASAQYSTTPSSNTTDPLLTVNTTSGLYTGFVDDKLPSVNQWLGIPFAVPPVGPLRFKAAVQAPYYGVRPAKEYGRLCVQNSDTTSGVFWTLVPEFQNTEPQSEDCLVLNIWAPKSPAVKKEKVPVIIWVVGGAFQEGGGHAPYQVPDRWIEMTQTHIVVTFNYRVNVFGFPAAAGAIGNPGLTDIRLAVEWVRDNIEGFGGDKDHMILWGQSAGANAVVTYSYGNPDDPIVSALVADSGAATSPGSVVNTTSFTVMAEAFNCTSAVPSEELVCMQRVDPFAIQAWVRNYSSSAFGAPRLGGIVADNVTAWANTTERLMMGRVAKIPLITGVNKNEGAAFAPFSLNETTPPDPEIVKQMDGNFVCGVDAEANGRAAHNLTTYRYLFKGNFSNITPRYWLGAMHSSELPLVFGTHDLFRGNSTKLEYATSHAMQSFWVSFATNALMAPVDSSGLTWPKYTGKNGSIIVFGDDADGGKAAQVESVDVMNDVFPLAEC